MFCENCGKQIEASDKFCVFCGHPLAQTKQHTSWFNYAWKALIVLILISAIGTYSSVLLDDSPTESDYAASLLEQLNPSIQPVGYYDLPEAFDSESITDEEWLSHIKYYEASETRFLPDEAGFQFPNQREIFSSVVKVVCVDSNSFVFGSGTNFDSAGYVLTNRHIVEGVSGRCVVGFPDPESGLIVEAYWATPVTDKEDLTGHDLAYLSIEEPLFDQEYNIYGYYSKLANSLFPYFEVTEECFNSPVQLGDKLFIVGYPPLSGGALTITNGLISSLYSLDGYIITSAKIISGNSGGLAVDWRGCYVGVPTAVYHEDGDEYLGEVIDAEFVDEFDEAVADDLELYMIFQ